MTKAEAENLYVALSSVYDIVRLVDPVKGQVLIPYPGGRVVPDPGHCYDLFKRSLPCIDCTGGKSMRLHRRQEKIELAGGELYHVICRPIEVDGKEYQLEIISRLQDDALLNGLTRDQLKDAVIQKNASAYTDALTGAFNRRYYEDTCFTFQSERAAALLEADGLDGIRDRFGNKASQEVIKRMADVIRSHTRSSDVLIRYSDTVFLLLFHEIGRDIFMHRMEDIRRNVETLWMPEFPKLSVTVSIGGVYRDGQDRPDMDVLSAMLKTAAEHGNRFCCPGHLREEPAAVLTSQEMDILAFSGDYHSIFAVDLTTGSMETYQSAGQFAGWISDTAKSDYNTYRRAFTEKFIPPEERDWFLQMTEPDAVRASLEQENVFYINHRLMKNGGIHYYQTKFVRDTRSADKNRILLGGHSIDSEMQRERRQEDLRERRELSLRRCIRVLNTESDIDSAIRELLAAITDYYGADRVYVCNITEDGTGVKNIYQYAPVASAGDLLSLEKMDSLCLREWMAAFRKKGEFYIRVPDDPEGRTPVHRLIAENGITSLALAPLFSGSEITGFVGVDNPSYGMDDLFLLRSVATFIYSELLKRNREQLKNAERLSLIAGLADDYDFVAFADLKKNSVKTYRVGPAFAATMSGWDDLHDYSFRHQMFADRFVVYEDRARYLEAMSREHILKEMEVSPVYYLNYTLILSGKKVPYQTKVVRSQQRSDCILYGMRSIESERQKELQLKKQLELTVAERTAELQDKNRLLHRVNEDVVEFMGSLTEARDKESGEHICRVKGFTNILAKQVMDDLPEHGLTVEKVELITSASALHDIGKIMIPDAILLKPGKLTKDEFDLMKTHCARGAEILQHAPRGWSAEYLQTGLDIVLSHHEKVDGRGYPLGLKGDEIPISAQIVSIADCYDALTTRRVYKEAYTPEEAYRMILNGECGAFSEKLLSCFRKCRERFEVYAGDAQEVYASAGTAVYATENLAGFRILLLADNAPSRNATRQILSGEGAEVVEADSAATANAALSGNNAGGIDAVIIDMTSPEEGHSIVRSFRSSKDQRIAGLPVIALTDRYSPELMDRCHKAGTDAFLIKPLTIAAVVETLLKCMRTRLSMLQSKPGAAAGSRGMPSRVRNINAFADMVQDLVKMMSSGELRFAIVLTDINSLQDINKRYGHAVGDLCIRNCCDLLTSVFDGSPVFRTGGDEFVIVLTDGNYEKRGALMDELKERVHKTVTLPDAMHGKVSFAAGISEYDPDKDDSVSAVLTRAEKSMLANKVLMS